MFLSQIPVHTAVPTTLSPGFDPSSENTTPFLSPSVLLRREKELANARRGWFKNGPEGAAVVYHIAAIALNRVFTRRWLRLFNLAGMPGFRGIESFWKGETRHPPRQILYRRFTVRMKSEFRRGGSGLDSLLSLSLSFRIFVPFRASSSVFDPRNGIFFECLDFSFHILVRGVLFRESG